MARPAQAPDDSDDEIIDGEVMADLHGDPDGMHIVSPSRKTRLNVKNVKELIFNSKCNLHMLSL